LVEWGKPLLRLVAVVSAHMSGNEVVELEVPYGGYD
jgi:hypothetical protein